MAKGNLLLGMGRGKLGDVVLYRQNGQQMSRPRVRVVKNPRTSGQQIQRMIQATIAYGYAGLKTIVDHSFEGVQYGQKSMSYFMKRNMDALRAQVIEAGNGSKNAIHLAVPNVRTLYPNKYVVSNGSLSPCIDPLFDHNLSPKCGLHFSSDALPAVNIKTLLSLFGCEIGDQLTFLILNYATSESEQIAQIGNERLQAVALAVRRLKFKDSYTENELAAVITDENFSSYFDMEVTSDDIRFLNDSEHGHGFCVYSLSLDEERIALGGCVIKSRKNGNSWLRSPQTIVLSNNMKDYDTIGFSLSTAYNAWMSGTTPVGVSEYILNGKPNTDVWPTVPDEGDDEENP